VLLRLAEHGIVTVEQVGNVTQYRINRSHVAFPVVERLAGLRSELFRRLSEEIAGWEISPLHASVFGSAARGDGGTASDIDLFIVRPHEVDADDRRWREQLDSLSRRVRDWTGNHAALAELSEDEARQARFSETVREMRSEGIPLAGVRIEELLEAVP
jgi:predicted nucleotidyltransferase